MTSQELEALIRAGKREDILAAAEEFAGEARSKLAQPLTKLYNKLQQEAHKPPGIENPNQQQWAEHTALNRSQRMCALIAVYRFGTWTDIHKLHDTSSMSPADFEDLFDIVFPNLEKERPEWLEKWATYVLDETSELNWPLVYRLIKAGLIPRPATDNFLLKMPRNPRFLRANSDLLQEVFGFFRMLPRTHRQLFWEEVQPDTGEEYSSLRHSGVEGFPFCWTLGRLSKEGLVDRQVLLSASLAALQMGRHPNDAAWFYKFHEFLEPTLDERAALQSVYCDLLTTDVSTVIAFGLEAINILHSAGRLQPQQFLDSASQVFGLKNKGTPTVVLKQLEQLAKGDDSLKADVAIAAAAGLAHESQDVQKATLRMLEGLKLQPDERVAAELATRAATVVASLRERAQKLLSKVSTGSTTPAALKPASALVLEPVPAASVSRIDDANRIAPIATLDELIVEVSGAIENIDHGQNLERILDGLSRLCMERPPDFEARVDPLAKRMKKLLGEFPSMAIFGLGLAGRLLATLRVWLKARKGQASTKTGEEIAEPVPAPPVYSEEPTEQQLQESHQAVSRRRGFGATDKHLSGLPTLAFVDSRMEELERWIGIGPARPLLAAPTHRGGWIAAADFVQRLQTLEKAGLDPQTYDLRQALLRLAPEGRESALLGASGLTGSRQQAIDWALDKCKPTTISDAAVYIAARAGREPLAPLQVSDAPVTYEPLKLTWYVTRALFSGGSANQNRWALTLQISPEAFQNPMFRFPPLTLCPFAHHAGRMPFPEGKAARLAEIWPGNLEPFFAAGAVAIVSELETTNNEIKYMTEFVPPLFDGNVSFSEMAQLLVACASLTKSNDIRGLATDALISVIQDGRCLGGELGTIYRRLLPSGMNRLNRLSEQLQTVARASARHLWVCGLIVQTMLSEIAALPDDAHYVLTPLIDWMAELNRPLEPAFAESLSKLPSSGKTSKLVKLLLKHHGSVKG